MTAGRERLALLGGTFDPIHRGHLEAGRAVRDALGLDRIVLIPASVPPHRPSQPRASAFHRFAMAAMAAGSEDRFEACDVELLAPGPSYTSTTLAAFHARGYAPAQLFFVTGADAFAEIAMWRHYPALLDAAHFVVVSRPGYDHEEVCRRAPDLRPRVIDLRGREAWRGTVPDAPSVIFLDATTPDISSTIVRRTIENGGSIDDMVPREVVRHINRHHLYRPPDGGSPVA